MEKEKLFNELDTNPSSVTVRYKEFQKLKKLANSIEQESFREDCYDLALINLDRAIENQAKFEKSLQEGSKHFNMCFEKLRFLEDIGRHEVACEYSKEIVKEIPGYSNLLLDMKDHCCTLGNHSEAKEFDKIWCDFQE